jgi:hypothetical protein
MNFVLRLSQASTPSHPNVFTVILHLSQGRAGKTWEPNNNMMNLLPPEVKCLSLLPHNFVFTPNILLSFLILSLFRASKC